VNFRHLVRLLRKYEIQWDPRVGKGSHGAFVGLTKKTQIRRVFALPRKQQKETDKKYLRALRRVFELTSGDGVKDALFK
jgi:hypothetical protein